MGRVTQQVLPLLPAEAKLVGPVAGLAEDPDGGGVVFVSGLATFTFDAGDEVGRRVAAVQLVTTRIASQFEVAAAFGIDVATVWRWKKTLGSDGVAGLIPGKTGPRRPNKLTDAVVVRIRELDAAGYSLTRIGAEVGVSTATVRVALGRRRGSAGWEARKSSGELIADVAGRVRDDATVEPVAELADITEGTVAEPADANSDSDDADVVALPVLPAPAPRTAERAAARWGLLDEAAPVFTEGAHLPLAGLLLILPALATTGLLEVFGKTYGRLRDGFYGLRVTVLTMLFLALLRDPRSEGATRINPADLGRLLGLDRAPEVKTLRRKLDELAQHRRGAELHHNLATAHAAARPDALGFLLVDGHTRAYFGKRDLQKTHIARLHMAARATGETWIADAAGDPVMVVAAKPAAGLASELVRLLPDIRDVVGPDRRATIIFDRGGWSPATFASIVDAQLDLITYRKGEFTPLPDTAFSVHTFTDPDGTPRAWSLAETTATFTVGKGRTLELRQIHKKTPDGTQIPILTSRRDLDTAQVCWRLGGRWRQENYFKYGRQHFALDALDCYDDVADDPDRMVPNPAKKRAKATITAAKQTLAEAEADLADAIDDAADKARRPGTGATAEVSRAATRAVTTARAQLEQARAASAATAERVALREVRPDARLLNEERKLITHAIRMAAYNAETTLARMLHGHYSRADDEARALIREAMTLPGDLELRDDTLHVRLDPATAPRRSRALHTICQQLSATETRYPETNLKIAYSVKDQPDHA